MFNKRNQSQTPEAPKSGVLDVLQRIWDTKLNSIALLEAWLRESENSEIRSGLAAQIADERQHARLVGEQIRRLGGRITSSARKDAATRVFEAARSTRDDAARLFALHRGVKAYTLDRCNHLLPFVDAGLRQVIERVARDEERHIRWADARVQRLLTYQNMRECNILLGRVKAQLEAAWNRDWRHLPWSATRRRQA